MTDPTPPRRPWWRNIDPLKAVYALLAFSLLAFVLVSSVALLVKIREQNREGEQWRRDHPPPTHRSKR